MNVKTNLLWYAKTESGKWTRFPIKAVGNGRLSPGVVIVDGKKKTYPEGYFQLRYREDGKFRYLNLGRDGAEAQRRAKELTEGRQLQKQVRGTAIEVVLPEDSPKTLATLRKDFIAMKKKEGLSRNGISGYMTALDAFFNVCAKTYPQEVERKDILNALERLRKDGYATHTIWNRYRRIKSFLEYAGADKAMLKDRFGMKKPKGEGVEIYSAEQLDRIFAYVGEIDEQDALVFTFAYMTGCREREIAFMEWHNFDFDHDKIKVRNKPDLGFRVKDCEARDIPMLADLKPRLQAWREKRGSRRFPFGTAKDQIEGHYLRRLKTHARNARLNCNLCEGCRLQSECYDWHLHKFRANFATTCLRNGIDVKTLQQWLGHSDIQATMRYLAALPAEHATEKLNGAFRRSNLVVMPAASEAQPRPVRRKLAKK